MKYAISPTLKFTLFADDTNIFYSGNNINNMCKSISRELSIVNEWFCVNKLSLYLEKTHFILFTNSKSVKNPVIKINYNFIERVKVTKNLGIYIIEDLSWIYQILVTSYQKVLQYFSMLAVSLIWLLTGINIVY